MIVSRKDRERAAKIIYAIRRHLSISHTLEMLNLPPVKKTYISWVHHNYPLTPPKFIHFVLNYYNENKHHPLLSKLFDN